MFFMKIELNLNLIKKYYHGARHVRSSLYDNRISWISMAAKPNEPLDRLYVCTKCNASFLFKEDAENHTQQMPTHRDFIYVQLE